MKGIAAVYSAILLTSACSSEDAIVGRLRSNSDGGPVAAAAGAGNSGAAESQDCGPTNPSVEIRSANDERVYTTCTGRIASTHFTNTLCVCSDAVVNGLLQTRGFDSSQGTYQAGLSDDSGAAIAVNGGYQASGYTDVGGSLSVAGPGGVKFTGYLSGRGDFRAAGDVTVVGSANVVRNAWLSGSFLGLGPATFGGELHHAGSVTALPLHSSSTVQWILRAGAVPRRGSPPAYAPNAAPVSAAPLASMATVDPAGRMAIAAVRTFARMAAASRWFRSCDAVKTA